MAGARDAETTHCPDAILSAVAASSHRHDILSAIRDRPLDRRTLANDLSIPRTTARHNLDALLDASLIEQTIDNEYRLTPVGAATLVGLEQFTNYVETTSRLEPFFDCVPPGDLGVDICQLTDASITVSKPPKPLAPSHRFLEILAAASTFTALTPTIPGSTDRFVDVLTNDGVDSQVLVPPTVGDLLDAATPVSKTVPRTTIVSEVPFGLAVADETVVILGFDDHGKPHALLETRASECRRWAVGRLAAFQR